MHNDGFLVPQLNYSHNAAYLPLSVLGTPSCLQAMYIQAEHIASLLLPFSDLVSVTCLNCVLALSCNNTHDVLLE